MHSDPTTQSHRDAGAALGLGLIISMASLASFVWLGREVIAGDTHVFDDRIRMLVHSYATPGLTRFMLGVTRWGSPTRLTPVGLILAVAFAVRGWRRGAVLALIVVIGAHLLNVLLKLLYARARPSPFFDYALPASYSFPSGHALFAASFFGGLAVLASRRLHSMPARVATWVVAVICIVTIGLSRVYLGVHYPSDVLGGWVIGAVWISTVTIGDRLSERRWRRREGMAT